MASASGIDWNVFHWNVINWNVYESVQKSYVNFNCAVRNNICMIYGIIHILLVYLDTGYCAQ